VSDIPGFGYERREDAIADPLPVDEQALLLDEIRTGFGDPTELGIDPHKVDKGIGKTMIDDMVAEDGQI
jgi:hypothetical protein